MDRRAEAARKVYEVTRPRLGAFLCDGYPRCDFAGTDTEVREHRRICSLSPTGDLYRVHMRAKDSA